MLTFHYCQVISSQCGAETSQHLENNDVTALKKKKDFASQNKYSMI